MFHYSDVWIYGRIILKKREHGDNAGSLPPHPALSPGVPGERGIIRVSRSGTLGEFYFLAKSLFFNSLRLRVFARNYILSAQ